MKSLLVSLVFAASLLAGQDAGQVDPAALVREVARSERAMQPRRMEYTWTTREVRRELDGRGEPKGEQVEVFETYPVKGEFARKLLSKNGVAVSPERAERELRQAVEEIERAEREAQRERPKAAAAAPPPPPHELPSFGFSSGYAHRSGLSNSSFTFAPWRFLRAAEFHTPRRETLNGRDMIVLDFRPRADFRPADDASKPYARLAGRVWIDAADKALARLEAWPVPAQARNETAPPAVVYEETRLPDGLWIQSLLRIRTVGSKEVFGGLTLDVSKEASDFRRFSTAGEDPKLDTPKP